MVKVSGGISQRGYIQLEDSALSSSVSRRSSPQDVTEHFYGVTLALVWHYYVHRRPRQHYDGRYRYHRQRRHMFAKGGDGWPAGDGR